ncbi:DUF362 domain-containing protein, partial [Candidatus Woesearchaeota archaeon]|nr:DUF362 domain-containing protein [Candidatus Woesearchaeota archaeon]
MLIEQKVSELFGTLDFKIKPKSRVLIKPNILIGVKPEKAVTTHPEFIRGLVWFLKKKKCDIIIADSSGFIGGGTTRHALEPTGMLKIGKEESVRVAALEEFKQSKHKIKGVMLSEVMKPDILDQVDMIINAPKLKTHSLTAITGAVKNMFGTVLGGQKQQYHNQASSAAKFAEIIVDIYEANKPHITVMDAI